MRRFADLTMKRYLNAARASWNVMTSIPARSNAVKAWIQDVHAHRA